MIQQSVLAPVGVDQCRQFLKGLRPKDESREIWVKFGHDSIYRATWDEKGNLSGTATSLVTKSDPSSRTNKGKPIPDLLKYLHSLSQKEDGGVFFVPTQPIGLPLAECVASTDDIGIEMDHLPMDEQKSVIAAFCKVTGIEFASVLTSGGASIHLHLKTDAHYPIEVMEYFRRMAVIAFQSDPVTVRLHQPMRLPGFFRKEKNAYQELLSLSDRRYTPDDLTCAFDRWFEYKNWPFTYTISGAWWSDVWHPLLASSNPSTPALKQSDTQRYLTEGDAAYLKRRAAESEQQRERIASLPSITGEKISDLVQACCDRANVGDFNGVDWQGSGGHYRGQCPFHEGKSGNSAWLSDAKGALRFHCSSCTGDAPRTSFEYWVAQHGLSSIDEHHGLKGKDYVEASKVFLSQYGVSLPQKERTNGKGVAPSDVTAFKPIPLEPNDHEDNPIWDGFDLGPSPTIYVGGGRLKAMREDIVRYLSEEAHYISRIYVQGGNEQWLARILTTDNRVDCYERLTVEKLTQVLNDKFSFKVKKAGGEDKEINCPAEIAKNIHSASRWPGMPMLKGIIKLPVLRLDGSVTMRNGYDAESQYLLDFNPKDFKLKANPTRKDAEAGLALLKDLISESALIDNKSKAGVLAMLLTAVSRNSYDYAPLFAISANTPGAGKGALTQVATIFASGTVDSGMTTFNPEEVEFKKALLSTLQRGTPVVSFDNVNRRHELGGSELESALTSPNFSGRMLGTNENGTFSTKVLWLANGNRLRLSIDMSRRTILITLDAKEENILDKEYQRDLIGYTLKNRGELVSAALTILQAYLQSKEPVGVKPLNGYVQWSAVVRNALIWIGEPDPTPTSKEIFSLDGIDEERSLLNNLLETWYSSNGSAAISAKNMLKQSNDQPLIMSVLCDVATDKRGGISASALGYYLRGVQGTRVGNKRFIKDMENEGEGVRWKVEIMDEPPDPSDRIEV